jgi:hypothetical protein
MLCGMMMRCTRFGCLGFVSQNGKEERQVLSPAAFNGHSPLERALSQPSLENYIYCSSALIYDTRCIACCIQYFESLFRLN